MAIMNGRVSKPRNPESRLKPSKDLEEKLLDAIDTDQADDDTVTEDLAGSLPPRQFAKRQFDTTSATDLLPAK
jgi:hypothetical protein